MTPTSVCFILLCGLIGIHSEDRHVRKIEANAGDSISVPCLYEPQYRDHVKYLCQGPLWDFCVYTAKTSGVHNVETNRGISGEISISDDRHNRIFTVIFHHLRQGHHGARFWCVVEIDEGLDVKQQFDLSVAQYTGTGNLYVDQQKVVGYKGKSLTIMCYCQRHNIMEWCRLGSSCMSTDTGRMDGTSITVLRTGFKVTIRGLKLESSGWYWCGRGDLQMPIHITVYAPAPTTTTTKSPSTTTGQKWPSVPASDPSAVQTTNSMDVMGDGGGLQDVKQGSFMLIIVMAPLIGLLLVISATLFGCWKLRRSEARREVTEVCQTDDMLYSNVLYRKHAAVSKQSETPDDCVTYSAVVVKDGARWKAEPAENCDGVIYSRVAPH
ncbi:polymeric immunoglobulin receptor-like isoform X2 [Genypterus blacodes]|uniref:polymeric immunoglobulin receptor-like isoform X2 n=1 Tax=Genypterus blacodes TaxID=154954 RepID=UPI003F77178B